MRLLLRARTGWGYLGGPARAFWRWLWSSRETTNFTYDLEERNRRHLAALLAEVLATGYEQVWAWLEELERDEALRRHVRETTLRSGHANADPDARFGRRIGWYAVARALKPRVIVETGVDKGLGACVLASALLRNAREGHPGRYYGTDLAADAGWLLAGDYASVGQVLRGDSLESLRRLEAPVDLFINDSDHSAAYEAAEYEAIAPKLSAHAILLGDNAHVTDALLEFSRRSGRRFVYFQERPLRHWYPGAGIGLSYPERPA